MIIEERFGNYYFGNLVIDNYPNLQSIIVKKNSLNNLNSLKICNCEKLKIIDIEDSDRKEDGVFGNVKNVIIDSTFHIIIILILSSKSTIIQSRK